MQSILGGVTQQAPKFVQILNNLWRINSMTNEQFQKVIEEAFERSKSILNKKEKEYSDGENRLDQFTKVSMLNQVAATEALWGMASKHVTSVASMVKHPSSYNLKTWREKLDDLRNYTFLLDALIIDLGIT